MILWTGVGLAAAHAISSSPADKPGEQGGVGKSGQLAFRRESEAAVGEGVDGEIADVSGRGERDAIRFPVGRKVVDAAESPPGRADANQQPRQPFLLAEP